MNHGDTVENRLSIKKVIGKSVKINGHQLYKGGGVIEGTRRTALRDIYETESIRHDDCCGDTASVIDVNIDEKY